MSESLAQGLFALLAVTLGAAGSLAGVSDGLCGWGSPTLTE